MKEEPNVSALVELRAKITKLNNVEMLRIIINALECAWHSEIIETEMKDLIEQSEEEWKNDKLIEWTEG